MNKNTGIGKHYSNNSKAKNRRKRNKLRPSLILTIGILIVLFFNTSNILAYLKDVYTVNNRFKVENAYIIVYDANGGTGTMDNQLIFYNTTKNLTLNTFTKSGYFFDGWNTSYDGSGIDYTDGQAVTNLTNVNNEQITLYAKWLTANGVAEVNGTVYETMADAIAAVPENGPKTTVRLLQDVQLSTRIEIPATKNVEFNLQNFTISNVHNVNIPIIDNYGTLDISNGTLTSDAPQGIINNKTGAKLTVRGGTLSATGTKQAIYNEGILEISGSAYLSNVVNNKPTVQNQASGTLIITGGTIVSSKNVAIENAGTMTIGTEDGTVNATTPMMQGSTYGIKSSVKFDFYDGIAKGKTAGIYDENNKVDDIESGYSIMHGTETINNNTYHTARLGIACYVIFDGNGGTPSEASRSVISHEAIGTLPTALRTGYTLVGWFTAPDENGTEIDANTIITTGTTFYAHWEVSDTAIMNGRTYRTLQQAVSAAPTDGTLTTITLLQDTAELITVNTGRNIIFDLQNHTLSNNGENRVIVNTGTITITNGTITSDAGYACIDNNENGVLTITGGNIIATGSRQAIYNDKGTLEISGTAYLSSSASDRPTVQNQAGGTVTISGGTIVSTNTTSKSAVENQAGGTMYITGGTITSNNRHAVENAGALTIGNKDGNIDTSSPVLQGYVYGINSTNEFNFYDGTIKGISKTIYGTVTDIETDSQEVESTETIGDATYKTVHLELIP